MTPRHQATSRTRRALLALPNTAPLVGAAVSIALGFLVTFVDSEKALLGLCVGLLGTVLAFQVDALARFERRAEREDRVAAILRRVGDETWVIDRFESVAEAVQAISGNRLFITAAQETLDDTASFFRRAGLGELRREVNYRDLVSLVNGTHESIKAVSLSRSERDFWSGRGQEYWWANREALRREVEIHRVFVYAEPDKEFDRVSALQALAGVHVSRVQEDRLPAGLNEHLLILDRLWSQEIQLGPDSRALKYVYQTDPAEVRGAEKVFEKIQAMASPLTRDDAAAELRGLGLEVPAEISTEAASAPDQF